MPHDLVIRDGLIVDGTGAQPYVGSVAIRDGRIVEVGTSVAKGAREVDASGAAVTPGFVDIHTHYDGQAIWSSHLDPSSRHGVTTAVVGNCGVGFAPCRAGDHDLLINAMEGVEDIPEVVMTTGLDWNWETFPQFLDALDSRARDIDIGVYIPHSPLRVYAMGERGANHESADMDDIARMSALVGEAVDAGALGFATSRTGFHRRGDGEYLPSFQAQEAELQAIAAKVGDRGVVQVIADLAARDNLDQQRAEIDLLTRISQTAGVTVTFTAVQTNSDPEEFTALMSWVAAANSRDQVRLRPQFAPRPLGVHVGLNLSTNPFAACPSYRALADLPLHERVAEMRKPEVRRRIVDEDPTGNVLPLVLASRQFDQTYVITDPPTYEPAPELSVEAIAAARGVSTAEMAYDLLLEDDGEAMLYVALANYGYRNLDHVAELFARPDTVIGLGDGGAHYGMICDGSYPTFVLTHWAHDRSGTQISLAEAVRMLAAVPAGTVGLRDRGVLAPGLKADVNVIDLERLRMHPPTVAFDLPSGGRRIKQLASGYRWTFVSGQPILRDDEMTGELPGKLVRGVRSA